MSAMTIEELYAYLSTPAFQRTEGSVFYNYYIYQYPAKDEYKIRADIQAVTSQLQRPTACINALALDLFTTFCAYLRGKPFGPQSYFDVMVEDELTQPAEVMTQLCYEASSDDFIRYVSEVIHDHMSREDHLRKPYVFIYGIGKMFPYLRTNVFLTRYERYNEPERYKLILFYPGSQDGNTFSLFGTLSDTHTYRAIMLVNK